MHVQFKKYSSISFSPEFMSIPQAFMGFQDMGIGTLGSGVFYCLKCD